MDRCNICWYCGGQLIWDNDFDLDDIYGEGSGEGIVTFLHCRECGAEVQYTIEFEEE